MHFDLVRPCKDCPFREDITFYLSPARTHEILTAILEEGRTFACHNTVEYADEDEEGNPFPRGHEQHCAGALLMAERLNRPSQMMRIAERLGLYDYTKLDRMARVFATPKAMVARMQALERSRR